VNNLPFHPGANTELQNAVEHYDGVRPGLGAELVEEIEGVLQRVLTFPEHGSPHRLGTRRVVLKRFPFSVIYLLSESEPIVLAVAHQRRRPGYWLNRMTSVSR
jgi:plasmid stabilization system protein ParE